MAVTLAQSALLSQNQLEKGVLEIFVNNSSILDRLPFEPIEGNAYAYNQEDTLPGVAFRAINAGYTESTGVVNQKTESLKILGGDADVDLFIQATRSNVNDQRAVQTALKVKAMDFAFQNAFFNGDSTVDANSFDGLKSRLVGNQVIDAGTNGIPILGSGVSDIHKFLDKLDELLAAVPGINSANGAIYASTALKAKITSALRQVNQQVFYEDVNGKRHLTWNGISILEAGSTPAGVQVLPQNETQGTSSAAGSLYAVKFGEDIADAGVTGLTNGGVRVRDLGEIADKPVLRTRIELYAGLAVFGGKGAARLRGVLAA